MPSENDRATPDPRTAGTADGSLRKSPSRAEVQRVLGRLQGKAPTAVEPVAPAAPAPSPVELAGELRRRFADWRRRRLGLRGTLLYLLPIPLAPAAVLALAGGDFSGAVSAAGAFAALVAGARLNRRGLREQLIAPERRYSRPARTPYGYLAAGLVAAGTAIAAAGAVGHGALVSGAFALMAAAGFHLSYPLPSPRALLPRRRPKGGDARLRAAIERAEGRVLAIELAAEGLGNPELEQRLRRIANQGRGILELIAGRPTELSRAQKFLNVYLEGAERVASRYVQTHRLTRSRSLESSFRNVLAEIEAVFERQRTQLLEHDVDDLDVQIEVLRKQLEREGLS
ncbi:MAG: 5-bromo-4-chloroindolyl phosphate hydrolysis family protein [Gammaproteobacteria bacterium]|jgi:hypothetical protein|nr:5-bromo-4-chloroindolyl phosphate hydrolysis family protein [Gammaproteobacteria bacterium]